MPLSEEDRTALSAYLDGELDEATQQQVEARLSQDPEARAEYDALRHAWSLLDFLPRSEPRPDFTNRTLERVRLDRQPGGVAGVFRRLSVPLAWVAGIVLVAGVGYGVGSHLPSRPAETSSEVDELLVRHLRVIELWPLYQNADDLDFLRKLDDPELFGDEPGS